MHLISLLATLALLPLFQSAIPAAMIHLTAACPRLLEDRHLRPPPYLPIWPTYAGLRLVSFICEVIKYCLLDIGLARRLMNIFLGFCMDLLDICQVLVLTLMTGAGWSVLATMVEHMKTLSSPKRPSFVDNDHQAAPSREEDASLRGRAIETVETYEQLARGLGPGLLFAITMKSLYVTLSSYTLLRSSRGYFESLQRSLYVAEGALVILVLILMSEDCLTSLQDIPPIIRYPYL
jgi:hypothetical protein